MAFRSKVLATVQRERLIPQGASVVVGLSGGADSVALLHVLLCLREELALGKVEAIHINHGLRGEESLRDQRFVESLCAQWEVPLTVHTYDVSAEAERLHQGVEEAGRTVRYACFEAEAKRIGGIVATAHTASDNAETVLLNLCRGSGLHGLCGIPPKRGCIVRPLIDCTREEVENYCCQHELSYVTDSSNSDIAYARNRVRHAILPELKHINPQAEAAIGRLIHSAVQWDAEITSEAALLLAHAKTGAESYSRERLLQGSSTVLSTALRMLFGERGKQRGSEYHIRRAITVLHEGGRLALPGGRLLTVTGDRMCLESSSMMSVFCFEDIEAGDVVTIDDDEWQLVALTREEYEQKLNFSKKWFLNACDYDKISGSMCLRSRREGDAFHPVGRGCGKTLKKLCNEAALSPMERTRLPILCDDRGIILAVGFGCDERVRITGTTKNVLVLKKTEDTSYGVDA